MPENARRRETPAGLTAQTFCQLDSAAIPHLPGSTPPFIPQKRQPPRMSPTDFIEKETCRP
jgi:hypothetical protein